MISKSRRNVRALVLAPTRELALQVSSHLNACLNYADTIPAEAIEGENVKKAGDKVVSKESRAKKGKGKEKVQDPETGTHTKSKPPPLVSVAAVIGGMSAQKQKRILSRGVDVLVATPGRLWDILQEVGQFPYASFNSPESVKCGISHGIKHSRLSENPGQQSRERYGEAAIPCARRGRPHDRNGTLCRDGKYPKAYSSPG